MTESTCLPFFHRWSKWSELVVNRQGRGVQTRTCEVCGKTQVRFA